MGDFESARVWALNYRLLKAVVAEATPAMEAQGLDSKEFFVLDDVEACPYPVELAKRLSIPKASMTGYLKSLEAKGFVRREIDPADLRRHRLVVTPRGREALNGARLALSSCFGERLGRLNPDERAEVSRLLAELAQ